MGQIFGEDCGEDIWDIGEVIGADIGEDIGEYCGEDIGDIGEEIGEDIGEYCSVLGFVYWRERPRILICMPFCGNVARRPTQWHQGAHSDHKSYQWPQGRPVTPGMPSDPRDAQWPHDYRGAEWPQGRQVAQCPVTPGAPIDPRGRPVTPGALIILQYLLNDTSGTGSVRVRYWSV